MIRVSVSQLLDYCANSKVHLVQRLRFLRDHGATLSDDDFSNIGNKLLKEVESVGEGDPNYARIKQLAGQIRMSIHRRDQQHSTTSG